MVFAVGGVGARRRPIRVRRLASATAPGARLTSAAPSLNVGRSLRQIAMANHQQGHRRPARNSASQEITDIELSLGL